jgi:hypothetical protein
MAQCEAAFNIRESFGAEKALGYLIGEKLVNFVEASDRHPDFSGELPKFVTEVRRIFQPWEIRTYLDNVRRVGALGHVCNEEEIEVLRAGGAINEDPVRAAEEVILVERIRKLLLG